MVDVKSAVGAAARAAEHFYEGKKLDQLDLEEVERTEDGRYWLITLGFDVARPRESNTLSAILDPTRNERRYKVFKIDANDGNVVSMKIREL